MDFVIRNRKGETLFRGNEGDAVSRASRLNWYSDYSGDLWVWVEVAPRLSNADIREAMELED